ncbi:MAG: peptidase M1 [Deltaproteobacteria bacterium]|nr:peptidase M1 [Deltaproteobacteria bacterium]
MNSSCSSRWWPVLCILAPWGLACDDGATPAADADVSTETEAGADADADAGADGDDESGADADADADAGPIPPDPSRDIRHTALAVDLATREATASIALAPAASTSASFEVGALEIREVRGADGPLPYAVEGARLDVLLGDTVDLVVSYSFPERPGTFDGWMRSGSTLVWPYWCGNLFPCHSDPSDGLTFDLAVADPGDGLVAVHPDAIPTDAPSYQLAWAVGDYGYTSLGTTSAGTELGMWTLPGGEAAAAAGTEGLVDAFEWYERTLGPYAFGDRAGPVAVDWPPGAIGGMEHHPFWHVDVLAMSLPLVHVHEAAHGWFGDAVRLACWEDLVLSEGTATYLAARASGQAIGSEAEAAAWAEYDRRLDAVFRSGDRVVLPAGCGEVDVLDDGLFSDAVYVKGAFFFRAVADAIGADELDRALRVFFSGHVGEAARMDDLLDAILAETGFDPGPLADAWLRNVGRP